MLRILNLWLHIDTDNELNELKTLVTKRLKIKESDFISFNLAKKSLDARPRSNGAIGFIYSVDIHLTEDLEQFIISQNLQNVRKQNPISYTMPSVAKIPPTKRPIIVGAGPAGMAAGLLLAQCGYQPVILERGEILEKRTYTVENFGKIGFKKESNIQFGEGGAAAFSAGLLRTRNKDERQQKMISDFMLSSKINEDSFVSDQPILGSDVYSSITISIRNEIIRLGGTFHFETKVEHLLILKDKIAGVFTNNLGVLYSDHVIMATGISARDTYKMLDDHGAIMEPLPFSVGIRLEHPKSVLNRAQYREYAYHPKIDPASYNLTYLSPDGRKVSPFAICPGGQILASGTDYGGLIVSGSTKSDKALPNTNSSLVVTVKLEDLPSKDLFAGIDFQRDLEQKAFKLGGRNYYAPTQLMSDFLAKRPSTEIRSVIPSYKPGVTLCNLHDILPDFVSENLINAIHSFAKRINGFDMDDAILTAIESRPASPIRILRSPTTMQSLSISGLYPAGDGAGYAAGIISSHIDGIKVAEAVISNFESM